MNLKFDRITINVRNLEEAKKFFSSLLGTTFEDMPEEIAQKRVKIEITPPVEGLEFRFAISPIGIELFETHPPVAVEGIRNITWKVEDIQEARREMKEKGVGLVFHSQCGGWKESVYKAEDMYGVRWVLNEYQGDSVIKALAGKGPRGE